MSLRFREKGQYLCSFVGDDSLFIDIMMNVGVVFYAARETNDRKLRDIAIRHALTTRRYLVRGDGSTAHEGIFDTATGEFLRTFHPAAVSAPIPVGHAVWRGLCTVSVPASNTRETRVSCKPLRPAPITSSRIPTRMAFRHGTSRPAPRRAKRSILRAAAIGAGALIRLCRMIPDPVKGFYYWSCALKILKSLCLKYTDPQ